MSSLIVSGKTPPCFEGMKDGWSGCVRIEMGGEPLTRYYYLFIPYAESLRDLGGIKYVLGVLSGIIERTVQEPVWLSEVDLENGSH